MNFSELFMQICQSR